MAHDDSPPDSPLSSVGTHEAEDEEMHEYDYPTIRPSKRQKVEAGSATSSAAVVHDVELEPAIPEPDVLEGMSDVSSDTSGDIPSSPANARLDEEDFQEQVTACEWDGCPAGDQHNMDRLVRHIHDSHIESRQKKYTCEWMSCNRKGLPHASGYALKAHMRSHTREKPFYCYLPECDRSFTRSDALAKHMRTVHETESLRPSDALPKTSHGTTGKNKLKIIIKTPQSNLGLDEVMDETIDGEDPHADLYTQLSKDLFTAEELSFPTDKLYRKCYWENKWAGEVGESLKKECKHWEEIYRKEWEEKEALMAQVITSEVDWHDRRQAILSGAVDFQLRECMGKTDMVMTNGDGDGETVIDDPDATKDEIQPSEVTA